MTTAQVVETSVSVNNDSSIQDYVHPDDQTQPTFKVSNNNWSIFFFLAFYFACLIISFYKKRQQQQHTHTHTKTFDL